MSLVSTQNIVPAAEVARRSANYHPSIWGDRFLTLPSNFTENDEFMEQEVEQLKEEVRKMLVGAGDNELSKQLKLIDSIQRLGVSYHFETEIEDALQHIYHTYHLSAFPHNQNDDDLYTTSLSFRLLRQEGHFVSSDVFNKFKDSKGKFKESLMNDVRGLLSLYEATHLSMHGEDILDEALTFTTIHLDSLASHLSNSLATQIMHALKQPIRKGLPRLKARHYISLYQEEDIGDEILLRFAKLDFNLLQKTHQRELYDIARWWKELDIQKKLPFARDRVVECYFWILGVYFEPQYFFARMILTKFIAMVSLLDDIFDVYGTLEELQLFTDAIDRLDINCMDQLPEYMRVCYGALLNVYSEIEREMLKEGNMYRVNYAKAAMKTLVRGFFDEAKWFHEGYIPTMQDYMCTALITTSYQMLATISFVGMGELATKEAFEWVSNNPKIVRAATIICRLMDDIVSHEFEQKRGHGPSSVECYLKQYPGASEEDAIAEFQKQVCNAWKDINEEFIRPTAAPMLLLMRVLNLARVMDLLYKDEDGYTHAHIMLKDHVTSLLVDSVPI